MDGKPKLASMASVDFQRWCTESSLNREWNHSQMFHVGNTCLHLGASQIWLKKLKNTMRITESLESRFIHSRKKGWSGEKNRGFVGERNWMCFQILSFWGREMSFWRNRGSFVLTKLTSRMMCSIRRATCNMSLNSSRYWTNGRFLGFDQYGNSKAEHFEIAIISWSIAPNPYAMSSTNLSPSWTKQKNTSLPTQPTYLVVLLKYIKTGNLKIDHPFQLSIWYIYIYIYIPHKWH